MKNFLPLIINILVVILFAILAFQSSKIIEGNTNASSSTDGACVYDKWSTTGTCIDGKIEQTQTLTSGGDSCDTTIKREIDCQTTSQTSNLTDNCIRPNDLTG